MKIKVNEFGTKNIILEEEDDQFSIIDNNYNAKREVFCVFWHDRIELTIYDSDKRGIEISAKKGHKITIRKF